MSNAAREYIHKAKMASRIKHELRARSNSLRAFETLRKVLSEIGWGSEPDKQNNCFRVDFGPPHIPVSNAVVGIPVPAERFELHINLGPAVSSERRDEVVRFITYANWQIPVGDFEMSYEQEYVRFKSSLDFSNIELPEALIRNTILSAMNTIELYAEALVDVIVGGKDAKQAMRSVHARRDKHVM
jgi:hypothetical protein